MPSFSLGAIDVPSAGTRVQITSSEIRASSVTFQAPVGNATATYVGLVTLVKATLVGALIVLQPGDAFTLSSSASTLSILLDQYYIDADTSGDDVLVSYFQG